MWPPPDAGGASGRFASPFEERHHHGRAGDAADGAFGRDVASREAPGLLDVAIGDVLRRVATINEADAAPRGVS